MAAILDEGTEARKKSMQLNGIQYATELASELVSHAKSMETWYNVFQKALKAQPQKGDDWFEEMFPKIAKKQEWYKEAKAGTS